MSRFVFIAVVMTAFSLAPACAGAATPVSETTPIDRAALCKRLEDVEIPPADRPNSEDARRLKGCVSENLYYGLGVARNLVDARKCAFEEQESSPLGGSAVLMQVYANGQGVSRNFDIALHMACGIAAAPAEMEGRIDHLLRMRQAYEHEKCGVGKENAADCAPILVCDDITSGLMQGWCASLASEIAEQPKKEAEKAMVARWPATHQQAFKRLDEVAKAYIDAHSRNEVDLSGTGRAAFIVDHSSYYLNLFRADIRGAENGKWPGRQPEFSQADKQMNDIYKKLLGDKDKLAGDNGGSVMPQQVRETQRLWLKYRDAFVSFLSLRHPEIQSDAIKSALTRERIKTLAAIPSIAPEEDE